MQEGPAAEIGTKLVVRGVWAVGRAETRPTGCAAPDRALADKLPRALR